MGTPNRQPKEYSRNSIEYEDPGRHIPFCIATVFLGFPFWGSQKGPFKHSTENPGGQPAIREYNLFLGFPRLGVAFWGSPFSGLSYFEVYIGHYHIFRTEYMPLFPTKGALRPKPLVAFPTSLGWGEA